MKYIIFVFTFLLVTNSNAVPQYSKFIKHFPGGLVLAKDMHPHPKIVEVNIEAKEALVQYTPGVFTKAYTYNGTVPGPLIKAKVGDLLIVNFKNSLPESTTIHWHGVRLSADMDGSSVGQLPIPPGGRFRYQFRLTDASLFWFHPHVQSNRQVEKGLAGTLLVTETNKHFIEENRYPHMRWNQWRLLFKQLYFQNALRRLGQSIFVLDDVLLDNQGQVKKAFSGSMKDILLEKINGREGNIFLVNGKQLPTVKVFPGLPVRWRLVNVANSRVMTISVPGHRLTRIGGDGGLLVKPIRGLESVTIVPGERADIIFVPRGKPGTELLVYWKDTPRGLHSVDIVGNKVKLGRSPLDGKRADKPIMKIVFKRRHKRRYSRLRYPPKLKRIKRIRVTSSAATQTLRFGHSMPAINGAIKFLINGKTFDELDSSTTPNAKVGDTQVWNLVNMTAGDHPFHLHGFFFQVLETIEKDKDGNVIKTISASHLENKDMVNLPRRPGPRGSTTTVKIAVKFSPPKGLPVKRIVASGGVPAIINADITHGLRGVSGGWQFHCHVLEHADLGMMSYVELTQ